jgi:hypothetical protein
MKQHSQARRAMQDELLVCWDSRITPRLVHYAGVTT